MATSYDPRVARIIEQEARRQGLDPEAMLAVAGGEGGVRWGGVGDSGTSFGPFQLHEGGALPKKYWGNEAAAKAFANSPAGIAYVARKMVEAGAGGLTGEAAVNTMIRGFERPANPDASVASAVGRLGDDQYPESAQTPGMPASMTTPLGGGLGGIAPNFKQLMTNFLMESSERAAKGQVPSTSSLLQLASMRKSLGAAESAFGPAPTGEPAPMKGPISLPLATPLGGSSEFGMADAEGAPDAQGKKYHAAKDWFSPAGSPVYAPWGGKIVEVKASRGNSGQVFGGVVKIQAQNGQVFVARHVDPRMGLKVGQMVRPGDAIAGVTDWKDGPSHAHVEVWKSLGGGYRFENMLDPVSLFGQPTSQAA